jgi:hypothetical protein
MGSPDTGARLTLAGGINSLELLLVLFY